VQIAEAIANAQLYSALRKTEQSLRESEEKYRLIAENTADLISILDMNLHFTYVSPASMRFRGFTAEEAMEQTLDQVLTPESLRLGLALFEEEMQLEASRTADPDRTRILELEEYKKDGSIILVEVHLSFLRDKDRKPVGIIIVSRDITERKRVEQETATLINIERLVGSTLEINKVYDQFATETQKLILFDNLTINLYTVQENTMCAAYIYGLDIDGRKPGDPLPIDGSLSEAVIRKRASLLVQPASTDDIIRQFRRLSVIVKAGIRSIICVPLIYRDEVIGVMHFRSKKQKAFTEHDHRLAERIGMQIAGAMANALLYSDLRKTERSLRNSEEKFRVLVEHAAVGITEVEAGTGRYIAVNPMLCKMLGRTEQEMLATTFFAVTHPEDQNLHPVLSKRMYDGEFDHYNLEKRYLRKDGEVIWVSLTISRLWKPGETPGRSITIVHDITERKKLEEALKETLDHLESRVRERTIELEETNTALRVLIKKGDKDQKTLEENLQSNINQLVMPFLSKLRVSQSDPERLTYLNILESNLDNIVSPFINRLSAAYKNLTPKEIQIAELIKQGKRSKEIAELFGISVGTVLTHRNKIRKKLNLKSKDANLRSHLLSLA
jgi:PAS domain S-box-containing protein